MQLKELLSLEWDKRTIAFYEYLKTEYGDRVATEYLEVSYRINSDTTPFREIEIAVDPFIKERSRRNPVSIRYLSAKVASCDNTYISKTEYQEAINAYLMQILHPQQLPMSKLDIEFMFFKDELEVSDYLLQKWLNDLRDRCLIKRFANPYKGNTFLFCHSEFREAPQVGDRVIELIRRRGSRVGVVTRFRRYTDRNLYPVVRWEFFVKDKEKPIARRFETFANPETIVIIERNYQQVAA